MQRFDEMELRSVLPLDAAVPLPALPAAPSTGAAWSRRLLGLITDLSLFAALALGLSPLLAAPAEWLAITGLAGFVILVSYYYFVGTWLLWGKTVGGAIFDVRVVPSNDPAMSVKAASLRWMGVLLSLVTLGIGFLASLPDRLSGTHSVST